MDKRIIKNFKYLRSTHSSRVKFGEKGSVPIDQTCSQDFNIDPNTGRPMSDIQRLVKMQDSYAMQSVFAQLNEFKSNYLPAETSDEDALKYLCPRLSQLPSELLSYKDGLTKMALEKQEQLAREKAIKDKQKADQEYMEQFKKELLDSNKPKES